MTREDIKNIFPDASDEAVTAMLNAHHNDSPKPKIGDDELNTLRDKAGKYDKIERDKLSLEEQAKQTLAEAEKLKSDNLKALNRTKALNEFVKGGITAEEAESIVDSIVGEDEEKTLGVVKAMCQLFKTKSDALIQAALENKVKGTPKPEDKGDGEDNNGKTEDEKLAERFGAGRSAAKANARKVLEHYVRR